MNTILTEGAAAERPSRLVAEALVLRQKPDVVKARAREMGLCENLTEAVVSVCCRDREARDSVTHVSPQQ